MVSKVLFSRSSDEWSTPQDFFDSLDDLYHFTLDPCASFENAKCSKFYTKDDDGLTKSWVGEVVFCNPPYSDIKSWIVKCCEECLKGVRIVCLVPARVDTKWFHEFVYNNPHCAYTFIKGRLKFGGSKSSAPFPSMVIDFKL